MAVQSSSDAARKAGNASRPDDSAPRFATMTRRTEFRRVYRSGKRVTIGPISVVSQACDEGETHVAFVAGRKVGSAVPRNRAKRRMRAAMNQVALTPGHDYIVIAQTTDGSFQGLVSALAEATARAVQ